MKRCLLLFGAVALFWSGCESPRACRLSKLQVVEVARRIGTEHGQDLQGYKAPDVFFDARNKTWYVSFSPKNAYSDRDPWRWGFGVDVGDETGTTTYNEHIFK